MVSNNFAILGIGTTELIIILVIILLLFGAKKLPALSRSLGESVGELRKGMDANKKPTDEKKNAEEKSL